MRRFVPGALTWLRWLCAPVAAGALVLAVVSTYCWVLYDWGTGNAGITGGGIRYYDYGGPWSSSGWYVSPTSLIGDWSGWSCFEVESVDEKGGAIAPRGVKVPLWTIVLLAAGGWWLGGLLRKWWVARLEGVCKNCLYPLGASAVCSECGAPTAAPSHPPSFTSPLEAP